MKIGFLYYTFFPVEGGAAIHGFHLAKELSLMGFQLYKINGDKDPYTTRLRNPITGFMWMLAKCELIYIRMDYFVKPRNLLVVLALLFGKRVLAELNSPSDELYLYGKSASYINVVDRLMSNILKRVETVIVVSEPIKQYCEIQLKLENVEVIENGANRFENSSENVSQDIIDQLDMIRKKWQRVVVWSGSMNKMQNLDLLKKLANRSVQKAAFLIIVKEEPGEYFPHMEAPNIFQWKKLNRPEVEYIIKSADIGLALYEEYDWCRWGFYNSSLKTYEYLSNGLLTISNKQGTAVQRNNPNFRFADNLDEMLTFIENEMPSNEAFNQNRTWKHVASEISNLIYRS